MNELKDKYKRDFERLRALVNVFDPCRLIALGAPVDEYDYLTNQVLGLQYKGESRDKIKETILFILADYFGQNIESLEEPHKTECYMALEKLLDETQNIG